MLTKPGGWLTSLAKPERSDDHRPCRLAIERSWGTRTADGRSITRAQLARYVRRAEYWFWRAAARSTLALGLQELGRFVRRQNADQAQRRLDDVFYALRKHRRCSFVQGGFLAL